jgi:hypothetical protein
MKRYGLFVWAMAVIALVFASLTVSSAAPGVRNYGPFAGGSVDSGTCGNSWANDTYNRFFKVLTEANPDGSYTVTEDFRQGSFVTIAGQSPGACEAGGNPNATVAAGVTGKFSGTFNIIVHAGVFNGAATPSDLDHDGQIGTTDFIGSVFGTSATYDFSQFNFQYSTKNNGSWTNSDTGNSGDITSNP